MEKADISEDSFDVIPTDDLLMCKTGQAIAGHLRPKAITYKNIPLDSSRTVLDTIDLCN